MQKSLLGMMHPSRARCRALDAQPTAGQGWTHLASKIGQSEVASTLLEQSLDPTALDQYLVDSIAIGSHSGGHVGLAWALLKHGTMARMRQRRQLILINSRNNGLTL